VRRSPVPGIRSSYTTGSKHGTSNRKPALES
jgi:hypothetical protein